jgi:hypothetical protein
MTDLTIPTFLKRSKTPKTAETPLSNIPSVPQDSKKASKPKAERLAKENTVQPRRSKLPVKDNAPPRQTAPAKRAKSEPKKPTAKVIELKAATPEKIRRAIIAKVPVAEKAVIQEPVKLDPEAVETAKAGHLPVPPEVTPKSSPAFKRILSDLIALAKKRDRDGLRAYNLTDRMALRRYRDLCVVALSSK